MHIESENPAKVNHFDGFIGIAPYTQNLAAMDSNFMYQLKKSGKIDHITASFYTQPKVGNFSSIKFGSYDEQGIAPGSQLSMYKTVDLTQWSVMAKDLQANGHDLTKHVDRKILFDMQLPYLYLPEYDYTSLQIAMAQFNLNLICSSSKNYCKFEQSCTTVSFNTWYLKFSLYDDVTGNTYSIPVTKNYMIPGSQLGDTDDTCYLPVFRSDQTAQDTWYVGNLFMNYFYMVFDMSPYDEKNMTYIQVGVAPINPANLIGQEVYVDNNQTTAGNDTSSSTDNSTIPLPPTPTPEPDPTPLPTNDTQNSTGPIVPEDKPIVTPTTPGSNNPKSLPLSTWLIIGGVAMLLIIIVVVTCCMRRNKDPYKLKTYSAISDDEAKKDSLAIN